MQPLPEDTTAPKVTVSTQFVFTHLIINFLLLVILYCSPHTSILQIIKIVAHNGSIQHYSLCVFVAYYFPMPAGVGIGCSFSAFQLFL